METRRNLVAASLAVAMSLAAIGTASAAPMFTTNQTSFGTATAAITFDLYDFNTTSALSNPTDFGDFSISSVDLRIRGEERFCATGDCLDIKNTRIPTFTFDAAVNAVSFNLGDLFTTAPSDLMISIDGGSEIIALSEVGRPEGTDQFFGIYDLGGTFTSFSIYSVANNDVNGLDDLRFGTLPVQATPPPPPPPPPPPTPTNNPPSAVSEPGTLALFGIGLLGLGFARRRKNV
jgi:hypothetical protein